MTPKTLTKERLEKFEGVIVQWLSTSPAIVDVTGDSTLLEREIKKIAKILADASISRSEVRGIEAAMFADRPVTEDDMEEKTIRFACNEFESALGFGSLPWDSTADWTELRKFVVKIYQSTPQAFREFETWRYGGGKYQGCTNKSISQNPRIFIHTHYPTFKASTAMYSKPVQKVYTPEPEPEYVPAPERKR